MKRKIVISGFFTVLSVSLWGALIFLSFSQPSVLWVFVLVTMVFVSFMTVTFVRQTIRDWREYQAIDAIIQEREFCQGCLDVDDCSVREQKVGE